MTTFFATVTVPVEADTAVSAEDALDVLVSNQRNLGCNGDVRTFEATTSMALADDAWA